MTKYSFRNDYSEGCHPNILEALLKSNNIQHEGYSEDDITIEATELIKKRVGNSNAEVHIIPGGTQANTIVIAQALKSFESVIAAETAHIAVHETGAIESTGHKINTVVTPDGKLIPSMIEKTLISHEDEHMVLPKMVLISNTTEVGTIYKKHELEALSACCKKNGLLLYMDGARLGSALTSKENDLTLEDIARLTDAFYIGGTKNGALIGEAIVLINDVLKTNFRFQIKQKGALLAKGRMLGMQFVELFKDNLFFELASHANEMAQELTNGIKSMNYEFVSDSPSNQIFPILPNNVIKELEKSYGFYVWKPFDENRSIIRLVTSWATKEEAVKEFISDLKGISI